MLVRNNRPKLLIAESDNGPKVWNRYHKNAPQDAVGIERNTKWGNPFSHLESTLAEYKVATREESIKKFKELLLSDPVAMETVKRELKGKHLLCCCKPRACHGDVLLEVANQ